MDPCGLHALCALSSVMTGRHRSFLGMIAATWLLCTSRPRRATFFFERERCVQNPGRLTRCALHAFLSRAHCRCERDVLSVSKRRRVVYYCVHQRKPYVHRFRASKQ